jgi:hypothetical protein
VVLEATSNAWYIYDRLQPLELCSLNWKVEPLSVERIESSFFEDQGLFPAGSLQFDCALLMRDIQHEWHSQEPLCYNDGE